MRAKVFLLAVLAGVCTAWAPGSPVSAAERQTLLTLPNTDVSAVERRKSRPAQRPAPYQRAYRAGPADPSIAPDGRPYRVPEYLRGQCYIDDGYGRFSACNNRN